MVTLNEIVKGAVNFFNIEKYVKPELELDERMNQHYKPMFTIVNHEHELPHIVKNLYANALDAITEKFGKYHKTRGVLRLKTYIKDDYDVLEIFDNGIGMDEETKRRFHEDGFTTKKGKDQLRLCGGVGIGMNGFLRTLGYYHGRYELESRLNEGTTFRLFLLPK
ncbi:hypothetical protein J4234_05160 [Candidatus Woesearchaeota archaeon]|nr:hypothetical protein [Candidatus Woesearchaeota archaeon]